MANTVTIGGTSLESIGWLVMDEPTLTPPEPKTVTVDIPGADGFIDLSESLLGDIPYGPRKDKFLVAYKGDGHDAALDELRRRVHGRRLEYVLSTEPQYTRTGRWTMGEPYHEGEAVFVELSAVSDPYKRGPDHFAMMPDAGGGYTINVVGGRKTVSPRITVYRETLFQLNGVEVLLHAGTTQDRRLVLREGDNAVFADTAYGGGDAVWGDWDGYDIGGLPVDRLYGLNWKNRPSGQEYGVLIEYEWSDI